MKICLYPGCPNFVKNNYHEGYCSNRCNEKATFDLAEEFFVKDKRNLTSRRSRVADSCIHWKSCCYARPECPNLYSCYQPPPA